MSEHLLPLELVSPAYEVPHDEMVGFCERHPNHPCILVTHKQVDLPSNGRCLVYPRKLNPFNYCATANYGIRRSEARVVLSTGIDWEYSPDLLKQAAEIEDRTALSFWVSLRGEDGRVVECNIHSSFATTMRMWHKVRGWDERFRHGWGQEDKDLRRRLRYLNVLRLARGRAVVYEHAWRNWRDGFRPDSYHRHSKTLRAGTWQRRDESEHWGQGMEGEEI